MYKDIDEKVLVNCMKNNERKNCIHKLFSKQ